MSAEFKPFDVGSVNSSSVVCVFGRRETGQNDIVKRVLSAHMDIPFMAVVSPTEDSSGFYHTFIPSRFIFGDYSAEVVDAFVKRQVRVRKEKLAEDYRGALVLDDCLHDNDGWISDRNVRTAVLNGRHLGILLIMAFQAVPEIPPSIRCNTDYVIISRNTSGRDRRALHDGYASMFGSLEALCHALDALPDNCQLVIQPGAPSNELKDQVFWLHGL